MSTRTLRGACGAALTLGVLLAGSVTVAGASESRPLEITKFTMQTTEQTRMVPVGGDSYEIEEVPYAFTQAGGHPWALTTTIEFASKEVEIEKSSGEKYRIILPTRDPKDVVVNLPPGLLGDPMAVPRCPLTIALTKGECPASTQIGVYRARIFGGKELLGPIVNVAPEAGQSAEFAFEHNFKVTFVLTAHLVRTENPVTKNREYGFTVVDNGVPAVEFSRVETTFWGVPADPSHDALRGRACGAEQFRRALSCSFRLSGEHSEVSPVPFLTMGTDCSAGPETATVRADSWEEPGSVAINGRYSEQWKEATAPFPSATSGVTGCNLLAFGPSIGVKPDTLLADEPVGLGFGLRVPQSLQPEATATPQLRDAVVTLPEGVSVSPGVVAGIKACEKEGPEGINIEGPESEQIGRNGEWQLAPGQCPAASTVGDAEAITPFLPEPVKGHVYLARPGCGNAALGQKACTEQDALDGNLYKLYLELGGKGALGNTGIEIKVEGQVEVNPATGQITTSFRENPQAPFSELKINLNGGPRAPLANPSVCGPAVTTADFTPWSAPGLTPQGLSVAGTPDAAPQSQPFHASGCASGPPLSPGMLAQMASSQAGQFSAFTFSISRKDREQYFSGVQLHTPPGLLGMLSSVPLCGEPQAQLGTCPEASRIGTTTVASGAGLDPFEISGNVYLTTGYKGAPFGLSIVTDAVAGPFNLGLVIVRAQIDVDPTTSTLTVTSDPLPQIIFGVPLRLQRITVNVDRPNFMFNPTNCNAQQITATVFGSEHAVANVATPFAVGACKALEFKPTFKVSTSGKTSRANGASLDAKVSYPVGALANDANIARVKVDLPKQLPSRLTTLQKACTAAQFNADPAGCPAASIVGIAKANTPLLPVGLSGPVYFVSHGGEAFPSLIVVLQGDGVRVDLTGSTFISKAGITSSTFKTVPDVPVNTFELYLPEGKYSALAANGNLCAARSGTVTVKRKVTQRVHGRTVHKTVTTRKTVPSLVMPTEFVAQNGAVIKQATKIAVTGCKASTARSARAHRARHNTTGQGRAGK
jgi:hypothetical protein